MPSNPEQEIRTDQELACTKLEKYNVCAATITNVSSEQAWSSTALYSKNLLATELIGTTRMKCNKVRADAYNQCTCQKIQLEPDVGTA